MKWRRRRRRRNVGGKPNSNMFSFNFLEHNENPSSTVGAKIVEAPDK